MKVPILLALQFVLGTITICSQINSTNERINTNQRIPHNDQVFVQTDRNIYRPGDTIFFQTYIKDKNTGAFKSKSKTLYVLLFNSQHEIIDSSRFRIEEFVAPGWMAIPENAKPGTYRFVAFTSMMQNFDPKEAFMLDLKVEKKGNVPLIAEITYNKQTYNPGDTVVATLKIRSIKKHLIIKQKFTYSMLSGEYQIKSDKSKTDENGISVLKFVVPDTLTKSPKLKVVINKDDNSPASNFNIPLKKQQINFDFLPEGGTLIEGIVQRIGFNATNSDGKPIFINGLLKNKNGHVIDTIKSEQYGPGMFTCKAEQGMYVELTNNEFDRKIWPINNITKKGICLSVVSKDKNNFVILLNSDKYNGEQIFIKGMMNEKQVMWLDLKMDNKKRIIFKTEGLPSGIVQISLFNKDMLPVAERLIYINASEKLKFSVIMDSTTYNPGQETELSITSSDSNGNLCSGIFSISVVDSISGINPELFIPGIEYAFNYHPYFLKNLPPKALQNGLENLSDEQLDLLLMVYGWSKIHNKNVLKESIAPMIANYDLLNMKVLYALNWRKENRRLDILSLNDLSKKHLFTDKKGEIALSMDSLNNKTRAIILMPDTKNKNKILGATLSIPYNKNYFKSKDLYALQPSFSEELFNKSSLSNELQTPDSILKIPEVVITQNSIQKFNDEYAEEYQTAITRSVGYEELWNCTSVELAIRKIVLPLFMDEDTIILNRSTSITLKAKPAFIVLDGVPIGNGGWSLVSSMLPSDLKSITILKSQEGFYQYGYDAIGGVIFVSTMYHDFDPKLQERYSNWLNRNEKGKLYIPIHIYRSYREFYNPSKSELAINPFLQERPTIYWNPLVYFDKEPVKIKFSNLKKPGKVKININGISSNNLIGTAGTSYIVK
jgi:alpha-2-macroglobulin-like protein